MVEGNIKYIAHIQEEHKSKDDNFGQLAVIDLHNADTSKFNKADMEEYCKQLCDATGMVRVISHECDWVKEVSEEEVAKEPFLEGPSFIQFIRTSSIVLHSVKIWQRLYVDFFSCKSFDPEVVKKITLDFFGGEIKQFVNLDRI